MITCIYSYLFTLVCDRKCNLTTVRYGSAEAYYDLEAFVGTIEITRVHPLLVISKSVDKRQKLFFN